MISVILIVCLFAINVLDGKKYGDRLADLQKRKDLDWTPQINKVFEGRDESELKQFFGADKNKVNNNLKNGGQKQSKKPSKPQNGRRISPVTNDRWMNKTRYKPNYWLLGHNKPGGGQGKGEGKGGGKGSQGNNQAFLVHEIEQTTFDHGDNFRTKRDVLPTNFDWRDNTNCQSLTDIRFQQCGDCWSVASASAISDRYCIYTGENRIFSALDTTVCTYPDKPGCEGGDALDALRRYKFTGLPTGGDPSVTDEPAGCLPYPDNLNDSTTCPTKCVNGSKFILKQAGDVYQIYSKNVTEIMNEIYWGGPVVAHMDIYDDIWYVGKGIYHHATEPVIDGHFVRLIGWGVDRGKKYWLAANSWGTDWGDNGYFKIRRGTNECGIETIINCALPTEAYH